LIQAFKPQCLIITGKLIAVQKHVHLYTLFKTASISTVYDTGDISFCYFAML